jgi:hypothetical protein
MRSSLGAPYNIVLVNKFYNTLTDFIVIT